MFKSLRQWMESIPGESELFDDPNDELLHTALASLLYHLIAADKHHGGREKHEFDRLLRQELGLGEDQVDHLYQAAKSSNGDLDDDLGVIDAHLRDNPIIRLQFLQKLLQLVSIHGAHSAELDLFFETVHRVFPDLGNVGQKPDY